MKKAILLIIGFISLTVGGIGIIFPVLPTTPFVLLAAICFMSSDKRLYEKLAKTKYFGEYIKNYREKSGVAKKTKIQSVIFLWLALVISAVIANNTVVYIVLSVVGAAVTIHILMIKTKKENKNMCSKQKFFICSHCGNLIGLIFNKGVPLVCCGEKMKELIPNTTEASLEKHLPQIIVDGNKVTVTVGSVLHPMTAEHHISFVYLETENGGQRKCLNGEPIAVFELSGDKPIAAFAYCNLHGLWRTDIK